MFVITVIPIDRAITIPSLPYLCSEDFPIGSIVTAPFKKSTYTCIVINSVDAVSIRADVKNAGFQLRGGVTRTGSYIPSAYIAKLLEYCSTHNAPTNAVFHGIFHPFVVFLTQTDFSTEPSHVHILQLPRPDRYAYYTELDSPSGVAIIFPDSSYAQDFAKQSKILAITTPYQCASFLNKNESFSGILATTLEYLPSVISKVRSVIFDQIKNPLYHLYLAPTLFVDRIPVLVNLFRSFARYTIMITDSALPFADTGGSSPSTEPEDTAKSAYSIPHTNPLIGERSKVKTREESLLDPWLESYQKGGSTRGIILSNQKEWFGYTTCPLCGYTKQCPDCNAFLRTERLANQSLEFACSRCSHRESVWDQCSQCQGYTLQSSRIGTDQYAQIVRERISDQLVYTLTRDTKNKKSTLKSWQETGGILVTTNHLFSYPPLAIADSLYVSSSLSPEGANMDPESLIWQLVTLCEYSQQVSLPEALLHRIFYYRFLHPETDQTSWQPQADYERAQSLHYGTKLPCTLW